MEYDPDVVNLNSIPDELKIKIISYIKKFSINYLLISKSYCNLLKNTILKFKLNKIEHITLYNYKNINFVLENCFNIKYCVIVNCSITKELLYKFLENNDKIIFLTLNKLYLINYDVYMIDKYCNSIKHLNLSNNDISEIKFTNNKNIEFLDISYNKYISDIRTLFTLFILKRVNITRCSINNEDIQDFIEYHLSPSLIISR